MTHPTNNNQIYFLLVCARNLEHVEFLVEYLKNHSIIEITLNGIRDLTDLDIANLCKALKDNTTVIRLDLGSNQITDEALISIAGMLKSNNTLSHLTLYNNPIGKDEKTVECLSEALQVNKSLELLNISDCSFNLETLSPLLRTISHSTHRDMSTLKIESRIKSEIGVLLDSSFQKSLEEALKQNRCNLIALSNAQLKQENKELKSGKAPILYSFLHSFTTRELLSAAFTTSFAVGVGLCHTYNQFTK